jgi:hypothetical protein
LVAKSCVARVRGSCHQIKRRSKYSGAPGSQAVFA